MYFEEALDKLREGKTMTRLGWTCGWSKIQNCIWVEKNSLQSMFGEQLRWKDMNANDWVIHSWQSNKEE